MSLIGSLALGMAIVGGGQAVPDKDARMAWWREARYGMFIHWGLYSIPAGEWNGKNYPGASEWLMHTAKIKPADYQPLLKQFNPINFDAKKWVQTAKDAGMKYIVITSRHHEGFALWPTKTGEFHIGNTPFKRDVLKELAAECKRQGIRLCFYHTILDWTHPDYLPRREWDDRDASKADFDRYVAFMKAQLEELLSGDYGDIGILWFDGEWEGTWTHERGKDLYAFVQKLQPSIIINNRVDKGRAGMQGLTRGDFMGDYGTPEQEIPPNGLPGVDWESCMTMNNSWGFHKNDHDWKSARTLLTNLIDIASKGGNYLLNVGPNSLGEMPPESTERLAEVGQWLKRNGESIYGTQAGPFPRPLPWGRVTQRPGKLYLHVFEPNLNRIELSGLRADLKRAYRLGRPAETVELVSSPADGWALEGVPGSQDVEVIVIEYDGKLEMEAVPVRADASGNLTLAANTAEVEGNAHFEAGDKNAIGFWTSLEDVVRWNLEVPADGDYRVDIEYACEPGSEGSKFRVEAGSGAVEGLVASTESWSHFKEEMLGTLKLVKGRRVLTVRASTMPKGAVMNLRAVRLKRL